MRTTHFGADGYCRHSNHLAPQLNPALQNPPMTLHRYIEQSQLSECQTMDFLQDEGIISDLCVMAEDVADSDQGAAIAFLERLIPAGKFLLG